MNLLVKIFISILFFANFFISLADEENSGNLENIELNLSQEGNSGILEEELNTGSIENKIEENFFAEKIDLDELLKYHNEDLENHDSSFANLVLILAFIFAIFIFIVGRISEKNIEKK